VSGGAYLIDSSICPLTFMATDDLIVTDRATTHLDDAGWLNPADAAQLREDRDRLATKLRSINQLLEPQAWAEGSRNRTLLMAAIHDVKEPA
jgi:hypothetical protein